MAKDPGPGTHSPAGNPYPLWCLFLKNRSKVSPSSCNTFNPNHGWQTQLRSTWLNRKNYFQLSSWTLLPQQRCPSSPAFDLVSLALLPPLTACIQVPAPRPTVELRVMWQVLAAACCLPSTKALFQLRLTTTLGAWEEREQCVKGGENVETWAANLEGHLQLTGIKSTFGFAFLDQLLVEGVRGGELLNQTVWVAQNDKPVQSEWSSIEITGKFSGFSLQSWHSHSCERLPKLSPSKSPVQQHEIKLSKIE